MGAPSSKTDLTCISNLSREEMLHGLIIRSHKIHARLLNIRCPDLPQDFYLISASDLGVRNRAEILGCSIPLFVEENCMYFGEPVALLIGPDQERLRAIGEQIQITFEELEASLDRENLPDDCIFLERSYTYGDPEKDFAECNRTIEGTYRNGIQDHHYLEPMGALAEPDGGNLKIYSPGTHIYLIRDIVAAATGMSKRSIHVFGCYPGDDLDGKLWYPAILAAQAAVAARISGKAVRILHSHEEDALYSPKRAASRIRITTAVSDENSEKRSRRVELDIDMGSYPVGAEDFLERCVYQLSGRYRLSSLEIKARILRTNSPPLGFFDGWGDSIGSFALETHYNRCAELLPADPGQLRSDTLAMPGDRLVSGVRIRSDADPGHVLQAVIRASDYSRKHAAYELQKKRRGEGSIQTDAQRGIGLAIAFHPPLYLGEKERMQSSAVGLRLDGDGSATILCSMYPGSAGAEQAWKKIVSEVLGLKISEIRIEAPNTVTCPDCGPETLSRSITICSKVLENCAQAINKRRFRDPLPIEVHRSFRLPRSNKKDARDIPDAYPVYASAAAVVETEIDPGTMKLNFRGIWLAIDGGRILQQSAALQRLEQGVYSAMGFLHSEVLELEHGRLQPNRILGYRIPRFGDFPDPQIQLIQPDRNAPSLGIGELPGMTIPAAGIQAISQASGLYLDQIPVTAENFYRYLQEQESSEEEDFEMMPIIDDAGTEGGLS
ncbi:xanthine dehydrogenase family protein molybdopterin-binding subunit [Spirochaeta dissipatitropha]